MLRRPFADDPCSGVVQLEIDAGGRLSGDGEIRTTHGIVGSHVLADEETGDVYVANYLSGSVVMLPDRLVVHQGRGTHPPRQECPHTHQAVFSPDRKYVCVTDLGLDKLFVYDRALRLCSEASVPPGHGARHLCFSPDGGTAFCVNELASTVSVFSWRDGALQYHHTVDTLPGRDKSRTDAASIRISADGRYLYTSKRGDDSISCFAVEGISLRLLAVVDSGGSCPRDFVLSSDGSLLVVANEDSDCLAVFALREGLPVLLRNQYPITRPFCVAFREE